MSASILSTYDRKQNSSSSRNSINNLKYKNHRILKPTFNQNSIILDQKQIGQQLMSECITIKELIQKHNLKIKAQRVPKTGLKVQQDLLNLHQIICSKDEEIKYLNQEISQLKAAKYKEESKSTLVLNQEKEMFQLAQELKQQRLQLNELIQNHSKKIKNHRMLYDAIKRLETVYLNKFKDREMSYEFFKQKQEENKMQEYSKLKRKDFKGTYIKQKIQNNHDHHQDGYTKIQNPLNNMKELQDKKRITQTALKNAKKKHHAELAELNAKLQFLRDENTLLDQKIKEKEVQKLNLEAKFNMNMQANSIRRAKGRELRQFSKLMTQ